MPQLVVAAAASYVSGAVVAAGYGALAGAVAAGVVSYGLSALLTPTQKSSGPRLGDLKTPQVTYGSVIPYVEGHPRLAGVIVWASDKREIATTNSSGKGGGSEVTTFTYEQDIMVMLAENVTAALRRVWRNGELIWSKADDATAVSRLVSDEAPLWTRITFYGGGPTQLPDPTYEAAVGVGNAPAYRTRTTVFIEGINLGNSGQLPNLTFEVATEIGAVSVATPPALELLFNTGNAADTSAFADTPTYVGASLAFPAEGNPPNGWVEFQGGADNIIHYAGAQVDKPQDTLMTITFRVRWRTLPFVTNTGLFRIFSGAKVTAIGFYLNAGIIGWNRSAADEMASSVAVAASVWTEIKFEVNPATLTATLYINGVSAMSQAYSQAAWGGSLIEVGPTIDGDFYPFDYDIDDFRITFGAIIEPGLISLAEPTLRAVVERQCARAGMDPAHVDASALATRKVRSLVVSQISSPRQILEMLSVAYLFTQVESELLRFKFRGGASVADVGFDELVTTGDESPLSITKANDLELPVQAFVRYSNVLDDYQDGSESSDRLVSSGLNTTQVELPVGLTPTEAKRIADVQVMDAVAGALRLGPFSLTRDHAALEPTDVITLTDADGNVFRARLTRKSEAGGVLTFDAVSDDAPILASAAKTSTAGYIYSVVVAPPVDTEYQLMDLPLLDDAHDQAGFYAVAKPSENVSFPGAMLFKSTDNVTFESVGSTTREGTFGTASTILGNGVTGVFDEQNRVTVNVGFGALSSVTRDVLLASGSTNLMRVGAELVQFRTAALVSAGFYILSGLLRGRRGTEWAVAGHGASEKVALLDTAVRRVPGSNAELGLLRYWKAVTLGRSAAGVVSEQFTNNGVSGKPFAPVDIRFARTPIVGDLTITAKRRTRRFTRMVGPLGISVPLGEESEQYELEIMNGALVMQLLTSATPSFTYTAAQQTADWGSPPSTLTVRMYQMSATLRRGYVAAATWFDGPSDQSFASVALLLHGNGINGSTTFTDNSQTPKTATVFGNASISTAQSKFGGASMAFDGTGDYLSFAHAVALDADGDYTLEGWIRPASVASLHAIAAKRPAGSFVGFQLLMSGDKLYCDVQGSGGTLTLTGTTAMGINTWYHVAFVRSGSTIYLFLDGVQEASGTILGTYSASVDALLIGRSPPQPPWDFSGHIDDVRITKGVARYTATFTPPAAAHPDW